MEYTYCNYGVLLLCVTALCTKNIFIIINSFASRLLRMGAEMSISFSSAGNLGLFLAREQQKSPHTELLHLICYKPAKDLGHLQGFYLAPHSEVLPICLYLTQRRQKDGDLSKEKREKWRQRVCTWFTKSHSCFVEELRFKPSQKCFQTTLCSRDPKEQQFAHEVRSSSAHWDAAQPGPTPSRSQKNQDFSSRVPTAIPWTGNANWSRFFSSLPDQLLPQLQEWACKDA